jgi:hypothetical protein
MDLSYGLSQMRCRLPGSSRRHARWVETFQAKRPNFSAPGHIVDPTITPTMHGGRFLLGASADTSQAATALNILVALHLIAGERS